MRVRADSQIRGNFKYKMIQVGKLKDDCHSEVTGIFSFGTLVGEDLSWVKAESYSIIIYIHTNEKNTGVFFLLGA